MLHTFTKAVATLLLIVVAMSHQGCDKDSVDAFPPIEWASNNCSVSGFGGLANQNVNWLEARARFSGGNKVFTLQLMNAGTSGSFIMPGKGWLTISLHLDTGENITVPITNKKQSPLPAEVPLNEATIVYTDAQTGQNTYLQGNIKLGRYSLTRSEERFEIDVSLDGMRLPNGDSFYGDISVESQASTGGNNPIVGGTNKACQERTLNFDLTYSAAGTVTKSGSLCLKITVNGTVKYFQACNLNPPGNGLQRTQFADVNMPVGIVDKSTTFNYTIESANSCCPNSSGYYAINPISGSVRLDCIPSNQLPAPDKIPLTFQYR
ncbi:hypothetical protein ACFSUS_23140 [Spirosoma soli]|uniref:Uncharacterized protein n=1 Tax=Spirosoma soli TaxID=1770529 RepID=A0ABW5MBD2_9BACT